VLIVGTGENAARLRERIQSNPYNNLEVVGFVRFDNEEDIAPGIESDILGRADQLVHYVGQGHIGEVVVAINRFSEQTAQDISAMLYKLQQFPVAVRLAPDYSEISFFRVVADNFEGMPLIGLRTPVFSPAQRLVKRGTDLLISLTIIIVGFPVFAAIALAIKLDSRGPIIFRQQRIGIHGRPFSMYKFRSMYDNLKQAQFDETKLDIMKRPDDPRVTRVGRFLRRSSLDELPQLFNVLKGEMSLVGPRPEMPARVQEYVWWQFKRFEVPQGMTGWWQVNGRANRPMHMNTEDDLYYIENYSLWMDFVILWRTIRVVFTGEGAF
jgi:exopolysaccharide biosynthesis polyprenyl glycosylphosphotransferase